MNILHKGRNVETRILLQESLPQPPVSQLVLLLSADFGSSVYLLFGAFRELCPPGTAGTFAQAGRRLSGSFPGFLSSVWGRGKSGHRHLQIKRGQYRPAGRPGSDRHGHL